MWKKLRHGVSFASLLITVVAVCFWVRSYFVAQVVLVPISSIDPDYGLAIQIDKGKLYVHGLSTRARWAMNNEEAGEIEFDDDNTYIFRHMTSWAFLSAPTSADDDFAARTSIQDGFQFAGLGVSVDAGEVTIMIPIWQIVLLSLLLPALNALLLIRHRRILAACCTRCDYDLRASTTTCPECGTPINRPIDKLPA